MLRLLRLASSISDLSNHSLHHHAAIVVRHGKIVATSCNWNWRHAEVRALMRTSEALWKGCIVYSFRFSKGKMLNARPCEACQAFMIAAGVKRVYYSTSSGEIKEMKL